MNRKYKLNGYEPIPTQAESPADKKSVHSKHGLKLIHGSKNRQVRVIIGNCDDDISEYLCELVKEASKNKNDLRFFISDDSEEILELADNEAIDIFILIMNNISCYDYHIRQRMENSIKLIFHLKSKYGRPVIALSGWTDDFSLIERVEEITDFFLPLPFEPSDFMEAVEESFDMLSLSNEGHRKRL
jgi:hypothetical protein